MQNLRFFVFIALFSFSSPAWSAWTCHGTCNQNRQELLGEISAYAPIQELSKFLMNCQEKSGNPLSPDAFNGCNEQRCVKRVINYVEAEGSGPSIEAAKAAAKSACEEQNYENRECGHWRTDGILPDFNCHET